MDHYLTVELVLLETVDLAEVKRPTQLCLPPRLSGVLSSGFIDSAIGMLDK